MLKDKVLALKDALIQDTQELVRFESVRESAGGPGKPFGTGNGLALEYFLKLGQKLGFQTVNYDGYAGHVEFGQGEEILAILCHLDVVPAGDNWTHPPFGGVIADGKLYGRGTVDNKGPAMACLYGLAALKDAGFIPERRIRIILGCDEESNWECIRYYLSKAETPTLGFAPDAEFPIINAEKGILVAGLRGQAPISGRWQLVSMEGGNRPNMVPDSCSVKLNMTSDGDQRQLLAALDRAGVKASLTCTGPVAELQFSGVSAHGSMPELGDNAVYKALKFLEAIGLSQGLIGVLTEKLAYQHNGEGLGIGFADQESGKLTVNLGVIKGDGESLEVRLDIRYPVTIQEEAVVAGLKTALAGSGEFSREGGIGALHVSADSALVRALQDVYTRCTGDEAKLLAIGGGTYARAIENAVAFGPVFPGQVELAHQRDEYISIDDLVKLAWIYAEAMQALGASK